jgi:hypothetical protein
MRRCRIARRVAWSPGAKTACIQEDCPLLVATKVFSRWLQPLRMCGSRSGCPGRPVWKRYRGVSDWYVPATLSVRPRGADRKVGDTCRIGWTAWPSRTSLLPSSLATNDGRGQP